MFGLDNNYSARTSNADRLICAMEERLSQRNVESLLFRGKKISDQTNAEKLEWFASELIKEHERRKKSLIPVIVLKQVMTPRSSTATTTVITGTTTTTSTTSTSASL